MSKNYTGGTNYSWPVRSDLAGWDSVADAALTVLSAHDHTGSGNGTAIATAAIAANAVTDTKIRLANNAAMRARNNAGAADVDLFKLTTGDLLSILQAFIISSTETVTTSTGLALTKTISILNGSSLATTLADGTAGQVKIVVNIASSSATVTPATTAGTNTATLVQHGIVLYFYVSGEWRSVAGSGCTLA